MLNKINAKASNHKYKQIIVSFICFLLLMSFGKLMAQTIQPIRPLDLKQVVINDPFWTPKYKLWNTITVNDVFDKLEGKYIPDRKDLIEEQKKLGKTRNAFTNFDRVAKGEKDIKIHDGPPWYDGLVYESIRGAADLLVKHPDKQLQNKIDGYINRIAKAQAIDPDGYINTYTTLTNSNRRWGTNNGDDKWQHDIYNAGMLAEAAVHYYNATHNTQLLNVAVKMSNYMFQQMGPAPKNNVIPGHGGPEEALLKLYYLFKNNPNLKKEIAAPVNEQEYYSLAKYWIENRGHYGEGVHSRKSDSSYNQDHQPVFEQKSIEGHAVRATLLATGVAAMAIENKDQRYIQTAKNYWDNMIGKRMFITGGEGAMANGERFGKNYFIPESAYLETCASIGAAFFSEQMNELQADGKYMDEFERVLYNNLLSGISLSGDHYHYENPLITKDHPRWAWHDCPCCPPMILKMIGALPSYIYATDDNALYVNLFIGSKGTTQLKNGNAIQVQQVTNYPWKGKSVITINPATAKNFTVKIRIPGWANSKENPFDLYHSKVNQQVTIKVNQKLIAYSVENGYVAINRKWNKQDIIEINLPVEPRLVTPNDSVQTLNGKIAIVAGPIVYGIEAIDNPELESYSINASTTLQLNYKPNLLNGINTITGVAKTANNKMVNFTAIPFYSIGNRNMSSPYKVWMLNQK